MEIRNLVAALHDVKKKEKLLQQELADVKDERNELEKLIKSKMEVSDEFANLSEEEFLLAMSDMANDNLISVEVVYALRDQQAIKAIQVPPGASIQDCLDVSELLTEFPEIDLKSNSVGIHGMVKPLTDVVREGDRVEIYRKITAKA